MVLILSMKCNFKYKKPFDPSLAAAKFIIMTSY